MARRYGCEMVEMRLEQSSLHMVFFSSVYPDRAIANTFRFEPPLSMDLLSLCTAPFCRALTARVSFKLNTAIAAACSNWCSLSSLSIIGRLGLSLSIDQPHIS